MINCKSLDLELIFQTPSLNITKVHEQSNAMSYNLHVKQVKISRIVHLHKNIISDISMHVNTAFQLKAGLLAQF